MKILQQKQKLRALRAINKKEIGSLCSAKRKVYACENCRIKIDRDVNGARNIRAAEPRDKTDEKFARHVNIENSREKCWLGLKLVITNAVREAE
jgi:transposase